jgi:hypothetical protein
MVIFGMPRQHQMVRAFAGHDDEADAVPEFETASDFIKFLLACGVEHGRALEVVNVAREAFANEAAGVTGNNDAGPDDTDLSTIAAELADFRARNFAHQH